MYSKDHFICGLCIYIYLHKICLILFQRRVSCFFFRISGTFYLFSNVTWSIFNNIAHNLTVFFHGCITHTYVVGKCVHKLIAI